MLEIIKKIIYNIFGLFFAIQLIRQIRIKLTFNAFTAK